jgi:hypothetical protein
MWKLAMATKEEAAVFLIEFHQKLKIWDIRVRDDRGKNTQALLNLEISPSQRLKIIEALSVTDYYKGPKMDTQNDGGPLWEFGKQFRNHMIYIKISMGSPNKPVICISFHEAEYEISFPFKGE